MLEEAKANVAEALGERAQVTVTPVAVAGYERPRRLPLTPPPMRLPHRPVDVSAPMEGGRRAREGGICRENTSRGERPEGLDSTTDGPQIGARSKRRGGLVDADYTTRDARLTQKGADLQAKSMARAQPSPSAERGARLARKRFATHAPHASGPMTQPGDAPQPVRWRGPESDWRHHDFQSTNATLEPCENRSNKANLDRPPNGKKSVDSGVLVAVRETSGARSPIDNRSTDLPNTPAACDGGRVLSRTLGC
jgi:hypothetical protein